METALKTQSFPGAGGNRHLRSNAWSPLQGLSGRRQVVSLAPHLSMSAWRRARRHGSPPTVIAKVLNEGSPLAFPPQFNGAWENGKPIRTSYALLRRLRRHSLVPWAYYAISPHEGVPLHYWSA